MSEPPRPPALDRSAMTVTYANYHQASGTAEELVLDFGLHSGAHTDTGPEPVALTQRLVLSWPTAKRLLHTLATLLQHHEARQGALTINPRISSPTSPAAAPVNGAPASSPDDSPPPAASE